MCWSVLARIVFQRQIIKILDLDIVLFLHTAMLKRIPKTESNS